MLLTSLIHTCLNWIPACCVLCGLPTRHSHNLCNACFNYCQVYSLPETTAYSNTYALFPYREPFIHMIRKLKFNHELIYAKTLGELLAREVSKRYQHQILPDLVIPVPLHPKRLQERGFNQAAEIAKHAVKTLPIPLNCHSVTRIKPTLAQSGLSKTERQQNMRNAFTCEARFEGQTIAILDDVVTTGQTVAELSSVLMRQGAKRVDVWCCARA